MPKTKKKETEEIVQYQWIKGENQGIIEDFVKEEGKFFVFKSGRKCNKNLLGEFINLVDPFNPALEFDDPLRNTEVKKVKPITPIPAKNANPIEKVSSPIIPLLDKAKKKKTKLNTRIEMELPSKEFLDVLQQSWDEDVLSIQAEYIVSQISDPKQFLVDKIKVSLADWFGQSSNK
tara:strand:+ start:157 stop:684 length:528 start_codon:yes stop_codon:yes gene_type:complete